MTIRVLLTSLLILFVSFFITPFTLADVTVNLPSQAADQSQMPPGILDKAVFTRSEQHTLVIHPRNHDNSTNVIFYVDTPTGPSYVAETVGHGDGVFAEYFDPPPGPGKYTSIEYTNDNGGFDCMFLSPAECSADSHFVKQFSFEITE